VWHWHPIAGANQKKNGWEKLHETNSYGMNNFGIMQRDGYLLVKGVAEPPFWHWLAGCWSVVDEDD